MSKQFASFGLIPDSQDQAAQSYYRTYINALPAAGVAYNLFQNQPVSIDSATGFIVPVTSASQEILGVFGGITYVDPNSKTIQTTNRYIANTQFMGMIDPVNQIVCKVSIMDVNDTLYRIQATGPLTNAAVTGQFNLDTTTTTVTNPDGSVFPFVGNTTPLLQAGSYFGISYAALNPTEVTGSGSTGQFVLFQNAYLPDNYLTDQYPIVCVKVNRTTKYANKVLP